MSAPATLFTTALDVLARVMRTEKGIKDIPNWKGRGQTLYSQMTRIYYIYKFLNKKLNVNAYSSTTYNSQNVSAKR